MEETKPYTWRYLNYALGVLFLVNLVNYMDRMVLSVLIEPIKAELMLSDTQIGLLTGFAFAIFYAVAGVAIARLADRYNRKKIIAAATLTWSLMTALTGAAVNFWYLFLARIGVGVGEAGAIPSSNAMIADYFRPEKRSSALAIFTAGAPVGLTVGLMLGGWVAERYGWRWAFVAAGVPGLPLALLLALTLREPSRGLTDGCIATASSESLGEVLRQLFKNKTYVNLLIASAFTSFSLFGIIQWMPALLVRKFDLGVAEVGAYFGTALGIGSGIGTIMGGFVANRLSLHDMRWLVRLPLITSFFYLPFYEIAVYAPTAYLSLFLIFAVNVIGGFSYGPLLAAIQSVVDPTRRATAAAVTGFCASFIGMGGAPFLVGLLSDLFTENMGSTDGLQTALAITILFSMLPVFSFLAALKTFTSDFVAGKLSLNAA